MRLKAAKALVRELDMDSTQEREVMQMFLTICEAVLIL